MVPIVWGAPGPPAPVVIVAPGRAPAALGVGGGGAGGHRVLRLSAPALAAQGPGDLDVDLGRKTFEIKCIACHEAGGNSLGGPGLGRESLASRGLGSAEAVAGVVAKGKGRMPSYGESAPPFARLTQEEIDAVSQFVVEQAEAGWPR